MINLKYNENFINDVFSTVKVGHKRIFLFTNEDNPNNTDQDIRDQSIQRAKDLSELGIDIELFSMNKKDDKFDPSLFYQHIISFDEEDSYTIQDL